MQRTSLATLTASEAAQKMREGLVTSEELVQDCLERIRATAQRQRVRAHDHELNAVIVQ